MLRIENLSCKVGRFSLNDISLSIKDQEYFVLLGPTGSGKTTLMKCIAGLYPAHHGQIFLNERCMTAAPAEDRKIGYVPQDFGLFPHMNVIENIEFGLRIKNESEVNISKKLAHILKLLRLEQISKRPIKHLSGGEKQRTAMARALVVEPELILLDEPFSSIEEGFKKSLWFEVKSILKELGIPVLHITHNLNEASVLGENIGILIDGNLMQTGDRAFTFEKPLSEDIARFLGYRNIFRGTVKNADKTSLSIKADNFTISAAPDGRYLPGDKVTFCIRDQDIKIIREGIDIKDELKDNIFSGSIIDTVFYTNHVTIFFRIENSPKTHDLELTFPAHIYKRHALSRGKKISVAPWKPGIIVF